jgi:hypothetical protein
MFQTTVTVTQISSREQGADHDEFLVEYEPN